MDNYKVIGESNSDLPYPKIKKLSFGEMMPKVFKLEQMILFIIGEHKKTLLHMLAIQPVRLLSLLLISCIWIQDKDLFGETLLEHILFGNTFIRISFYFQLELTEIEFWEHKFAYGEKFQIKILWKTIYGWEQQHLLIDFGMKINLV